MTINKKAKQKSSRKWNLSSKGENFKFLKKTTCQKMIVMATSNLMSFDMLLQIALAALSCT